MQRQELVEQIYLNRGIAGLGVEEIDDVLSTLEDLGVSVVSLRQVGWVSQDDHSLSELETDEDSIPPRSLPVYAAGKVHFFLPELDYLEAGSEPSRG